MKLSVALALAAAMMGVSPRARAQEPQPWTNSDDLGARVVTAFPTDPGGGREFAYRVRGALTGGWSSNINGGCYGGGGCTGTGPYDQSGIGMSMGGAEGIVAADIPSVEGLEGFLSAVSYATGFSGATGYFTTNNPNQLGSPAYQWGDDALGLRYRHALVGGGMAWGAEGGAMLLGGSSTGSGGFAGPNTSATGYFARGLFSWRGGKGLLLSGNAGLYFDNSWQIWKAAATNQTPPVTRDISGEERIALGVSGQGDSVLREVGGIQLARDLEGSRMRPFLEVSFEETQGDLGWRISPGLAWRSGNLSLVGYLDAAPTGSSLTKAPEEPLLRAGLGLSYAFGSRAPYVPKPIAALPLKAAYRVQVSDQAHGAVKDAPVVVYMRWRIGQKSHPVLTNQEGMAYIPRDQLTNAHYAAIEMGFPGAEQWPDPALHGQALSDDGIAHLTVLVPSPTVTRTRFEFFDEHNKPLARPVELRLTLNPVTPTLRDLGANEFVLSAPPYTLDRLIPAGDWSVMLSAQPPGGTAQVITQGNGTPISIKPGPTPAIPLYVDLNREVGILSLTPFVTVWMKNLPGLFDPDLAELKPGSEGMKELNELLTVLARPENQARRVYLTVQMKSGGDPLFLKTLASARLDAISQFLRSHKVEPSRIARPPQQPDPGESEVITAEVK